MTVSELRNKLDHFDDDAIVVAFTSEEDYLVDVFLEQTNISYDGHFSSDPNQKYYSKTSFGNPAVVVSIKPPKGS